MKENIIQYNDKIYPESLKQLKNPPLRIHAIGNIDLLNQKGIAVIGSRHNSEYGKRMCQKFTKELIEYNLVIISGLAIGIDSFAHETCLKYNGKTIAVLPSGLNEIYPKHNLKLVENIIKNNGLVISEYDDNVSADSKKFLERNRIVAALGIGTLVVEAGYRSGTSVTAKYTQTLGKRVFCIPSSLENSKGVTTNELIKKGGILVSNVDDIISKYKNIKFEKVQVTSKMILPDISEELLEIYKVIYENPKDINQITVECKKEIREISYKITLLQLQNLIEELPGKRYIVKKEGDELHK